MRNHRININTADYWNKRQTRKKGLHQYEDFKTKHHIKIVMNDIKSRNLDKVSILDIGCAVGTQLKVIKDLLPDVELDLYGIDISDEMIRQAEELLPNATFFVRDINDFIKDNTMCFDYVISNHVFEHFDNPYDIAYYFIEHTNLIMSFEVPYGINIDAPDHVHYFFSEEFDKYDYIKSTYREDSSSNLFWKTLTFTFDCYKR